MEQEFKIVITGDDVDLIKINKEEIKEEQIIEEPDDTERSGELEDIPEPILIVDKQFEKPKYKTKPKLIYLKK